MNYFNMTKEQLKTEYERLIQDYKNYQNKNLKLDMSRGKPSKEQLDLSNEMLNLNISDIEIDNFDVRNYGCLTGLPEVKKLFSDIFDIRNDEIIIGGNSSLNLMHDIISNLMLLPSSDLDKPWCQYKEIKFLCPVPGYDRHFSICEKFGIKMINIEMNDDGPNMDQIDQLIREDETIKGVWCVPMYSNPTGITYSDETVKRFSNLNPKARDFKIFWDNAYAVHHLYDKHNRLLNLISECKKNNKEDMVYQFGSTSKMTFPGAGISFLISSKNNISQVEKWISSQTIGYDKINQLRHLLFFKDSQGVREHMKKHAQILRPKFQMVDKILRENLKGTNLATWSRPLGGYFISLNTIEGCAKRVINLCQKASVIFTSAGATFPYGKDYKDNNIRIAPSYPTIDELKTSMELFCLSVKIASAEKLINNNIK